MESSVTRLLVSTKMLLEALTQWSQAQRTEEQVSDVYVRLGNDFNAALAAFTSYGIDMSDLYSVPPDLRVCLEACLSEPASPAALDEHLPRIREIIIRLLQGLKTKQASYKQLVLDQRAAAARPPQAPSRAAGAPAPPAEPAAAAAAAGSPGAPAAAAPGVPAAPAPADKPPSPPAGPRPLGGASAAPAPPLSESFYSQRPSGPTPVSRSLLSALGPRSEAPRPSTPQQAAAQGEAPASETVPLRSERDAAAAVLERSRNSVEASPSATAEGADPNLRALRSRDALERRASKRFSAYNFNKMGLGGGPGSASQSSTPRERTGLSPPRLSYLSGERLQPIAGEDAADVSVSSAMSMPAGISQSEDVFGAVDQSHPRLTSWSGAPSQRRVSSTASASAEQPAEPKPLPEEEPYEAIGAPEQEEEAHEADRTAQAAAPAPAPAAAANAPPAPAPRDARPAPAAQETAAPAEATPPASLLHVFLQLGRRIRKAPLSLDLQQPARGLSTAKLRMMFMDQFTYSPGMDDFPEIYIRDPNSGVQYQLENMDDVQDGCLLTLNIEPLDQVKQHVDLTLTGVSRELRELRQLFREQLSSLTQAREAPAARDASAPRTSDVHTALPISDSQFRAAADRMLEEPGAAGGAARGAAGLGGTHAAEGLKHQYQELQGLRRELAVLRQVYDEGEADMRGTFTNVREQVKEFVRVTNLGPSAGRNLIESGKRELDSHSQQALTNVEDLQDMIEDLKLDVSHRGVKPKPAEMRRIANDIGKATERLEKLEQYIQTVKPGWKKTWETELQNIVDEQEFLNYQEGLLADLRQDHKALQDVFANIQQVVKLRGAAGPDGAAGGRSTGPRFVPPPPDAEHEGLDTVMIEVRGQTIDHERRVRALQTAERSREKARAGRKDEFADELAGFVDGKVLRKTGGHLEAERVRQKRDHATLRRMLGEDNPETGTESSPASAPATSPIGTSHMELPGALPEERSQTSADPVPVPQSLGLSPGSAQTSGSPSLS